MHIQIGVITSRLDGGGLEITHCVDEYEALELLKTILGGITRGQEMPARDGDRLLSARPTDNDAGPIDIPMYEGRRIYAITITLIVRTLDDVLNPAKLVEHIDVEEDQT